MPRVIYFEIAVDNPGRAVQFYTKAFEIVQSKMAIPGIGYNAFWKDSKGNTFGIMRDDPKAK